MAVIGELPIIHARRFTDGSEILEFEVEAVHRNAQHQIQLVLSLAIKSAIAPVLSFWMYLVLDFGDQCPAVSVRYKKTPGSVLPRSITPAKPIASRVRQ